jgi:hypothetical protein
MSLPADVRLILPLGTPLTGAASLVILVRRLLVLELKRLISLVLLSADDHGRAVYLAYDLVGQPNNSSHINIYVIGLFI